MTKPRITPRMRAASLIDPEFYLKYVLGLDHPTTYQVGIANALADPDVSEVAARSANGVGKSFLAACLLNWWFDTREDSKVIIAGPRFQQAKETFAKGMLLRASSPFALDGDIQAEQLSISADWLVQPRSAKDAERFAGVHAKGGVLLIMEEASGQEDAIYAAAYGCATEDVDKILHIGNPTKPVGIFATLWKTQGVRTFTISAMDSPNYIAGKSLVPGLVGRKGVQRLIDRFGAESDVVRVRVHGLPPQGTGNGVFSFRDIQDAIERGLERFDESEDGGWSDRQALLDHRVRGGLDVARMGDDTCRLATIIDGVLQPGIEVWEKARTTVTRDRALAWFKRHPDDALLNLDAGGGGAEVYDTLLEKGVPKRKMRLTNFGGRQIHGQFFSPSGEIVKRGKSWDQESIPLYHDRRTELWAEAAKWCRTKGVIHPGFSDHDMEEMEAELLAPEWSPNERKSLLMEPKKDTKKRLGRSPDVGDAVCLAIDAEIGLPSISLPRPTRKTDSPKRRARVKKRDPIGLRGYTARGAKRLLESDW